ncbi:PhzF family phenazine biosynthesis protein [Spirulina sp. CS-785/01]|uniref:PhzF family phenazine biosynthesis protein n=1 Tax=Spirulina sp. CS-785/01 TaxID=3021716 RepID=UPI00232F78D1|nr:PhzF family phenazine biosynthesis protein [Spirulina sp. CS-785/01]MDB9314100.1 PhzF family phenazine biosynthesis protein [Spirulina sp. CS-785/01]
MSLPFFIVDVFAVESLTGNPLAVVLDEGKLDESKMLAIAREMNYSETTFIRSTDPQNGGYPVRIFTPTKELPFAGHPTLGTAYILLQNLLNQPLENLKLNLPVGQIPVRVNRDEQGNLLLWMQQNSPNFYDNFNPHEIAEILGISPGQIDYRFPIQAVSTGIPFIIVPLKNLQAVKDSKIQREQYFDWIQDKRAQEILVFSPETYNPQHQLNVRVFAEAIGIPEDPATGSANGCLAAYLSQHNYFGTPDFDIQVEQGYEINRPSLLYLKTDIAATKIQVFVGGKVLLVAQGELV